MGKQTGETAGGRRHLGSLRHFQSLNFEISPQNDGAIGDKNQANMYTFQVLYFKSICVRRCEFQFDHVCGVELIKQCSLNIGTYKP